MRLWMYFGCVYISFDVCYCKEPSVTKQMSSKGRTTFPKD